jgi:hypothetical protein
MDRYPQAYTLGSQVDDKTYGLPGASGTRRC